jgi:DNA adenine methylase
MYNFINYLEDDMIKFFNYMGTKIKYVDLINREINKTDKKIYVEPFLGSGSVFLNLEKEFDNYILNDKDRNVTTIFKSFKNGDYSEYENSLLTVKRDFGDIEEKETYYNFRNYFNMEHYKTDSNLEGFYLFTLYNACINSMARFGPNGFNQGCGKRGKILDKREFNLINSRLSRAEIYNLDFFELNLPDNSFMFLDPPYIAKEGSYETISEDYFKQFINFVTNSNNDIVYTDTSHDFLPNFNKTTIRTMRNSSPNRIDEYTVSECMYSNMEEDLFG